MPIVTESFTTYGKAYDAVTALKQADVDTNNISIITTDADQLSTWQRNSEVSNSAATGASVGAAIGGVGGALAGVGLITIPGVGPVIAAGWLAATLAGLVYGAVAGAATGGLIGAFANEGLTDDEALFYEDQLRLGRTLVSVRAEDTETADKIRTILHHHSLDLAERAYPQQINRENTGKRL